MRRAGDLNRLAGRPEQARDPNLRILELDLLYQRVEGWLRQELAAQRAWIRAGMGLELDAQKVARDGARVFDLVNFVRYGAKDTKAARLGWGCG